MIHLCLKSIILDIITKLYISGYNVGLLTSDMGTSNIALWNSLGISQEYSSFIHPVTNRGVHVFADKDNGFLLNTIIVQKIM